MDAYKHFTENSTILKKLRDFKMLRKSSRRLHYGMGVQLFKCSLVVFIPLISQHINLIKYINYYNKAGNTTIDMPNGNFTQIWCYRIFRII